MNNEGKKRKVLFITPNYMDYTDLIRAGISEYLDAETYLVTTTGNELKFSYRDSFHRIQNFFSKLILQKNQKKVFYHKAIKKKLEAVIEKNSSFDDILILRPDLIKEHLRFITDRGKRSIAYFWDSFSRLPKGKETIQFFDKFLSFEPKDVKDHHLLFLPNFYSPELIANKNDILHFDLSYVASYDDRIEKLEEILASLRPLELKTNINIIATKPGGLKNRNEKDIAWFTNVLPRNETIRIMNDSRVLLDIAQPKQEGLSFRVFEALALEKKLITTNDSIKSYDFYDSQNIFIWENENTVPPKSFFTMPYSPVPDAILKKYSLENWVKRIFEE